MDIIVCVKRIPDSVSAGALKIDTSGKDIEKGMIAFKINEWDEYALEAAVQVKKKLGGTVTVVTVGTKDCDDTLRRALALDADRAIRIDEDVTTADSYVVAKTLAALIANMPHDLILFGMQSEDFGRAQLGAMVAEILGNSHAIGVVRIEGKEDGQVEVARELEGGALELYTIKLPALLTVQTGIHKLRYPSFISIRNAKKKELKVMTLSDLGLSRDALTPKVKLERIAFPPVGEKGEIISGSSDEVGTKLSELLKELGAF